MIHHSVSKLFLTCCALSLFLGYIFKMFLLFDRSAAKSGQLAAVTRPCAVSRGAEDVQIEACATDGGSVRVGVRVCVCASQQERRGKRPLGRQRPSFCYQKLGSSSPNRI